MASKILLLASLLVATTPGTAAGDPGSLAGKEVYDKVCSTCHATGVNGAPRSGDKDAWIPRLKGGLPATSLSAIRGHGGMPPRGGHAELTDAEVRSAIVYMFDPGAEARAAARPAPALPPARGPNQVTVNGIEVNFGLVPAERLRAYPRDSAEALMHGGVPPGGGHYHVNVTLFDAGSHAQIRDASVEVDVVQPGTAAQRKRLETMRSQNAASYGEYVRLAAKVPSTITVRIRPAGSDRVTEARFTPTPE